MHIASEERMARTITVRLDDATYEMIRSAARGERRSVANFLEYAAVSFVTQHAQVSDEEMDELLGDADLARELEAGRADYREHRYRVVD